MFVCMNNCTAADDIHNQTVPRPFAIGWKRSAAQSSRAFRRWRRW
jgi:hypothetical protein